MGLGAAPTAAPTFAAHAPTPQPSRGPGPTVAPSAYPTFAKGYACVCLLRSECCDPLIARCLLCLWYHLPSSPFTTGISSRQQIHLTHVHPRLWRPVCITTMRTIRYAGG
jgi:hypothetical protein